MKIETEKVIQVSGFGVNNNPTTQCDWIVLGLTTKGKILMNRSTSENWVDITPKEELS